MAQAWKHWQIVLRGGDCASLKILVVVSRNCTCVCLWCFWQKNRWALSLVLTVDAPHQQNSHNAAETGCLGWLLKDADCYRSVRDCHDHSASSTTSPTLNLWPHRKPGPGEEGGQQNQGRVDTEQQGLQVCLPVQCHLDCINGCQWILLNYFRGRQQDNHLLWCPGCVWLTALSAAPREGALLWI